MQRLATLAVVAALISPAVASGQDYSFGDWARDQGYESGDVMGSRVCVSNSSPAIDSLDGISEFDWTTAPTTKLQLDDNQLTSIESGDFSGLTLLEELELYHNQISSIEPDDFNGLTNLLLLYLTGNQISNIEPGGFSELTNLRELYLTGNQISSIESGDFSGPANRWTLYMGLNQISSIEPGDFNGLTNLGGLFLDGNHISTIESGGFSELTTLDDLWLNDNQLSSIESGAFSGLTNLTELRLSGNTALTELNLEAADFSNLTWIDVKGNTNISRVSLKNTVVYQASFAALLHGIGILDGITAMDLSGVDFANITDLRPLHRMDDLTDLWLVNTENLDATELDLLLGNLETIEGANTEGVLYMTEADFDAFNEAGGGLLADWDVEPGHHVEFLQIGDVNHDTEVNGLDVDPFVDVLLASRFDVAADMNGDGVVNGLDVEPFVAAVVGGTQPVPEPSTLLLALAALGVVGGWRKWGV